MAMKWRTMVMKNEQYKLSKKVVGKIIFSQPECANKFYSLYSRYSPCKPTLAYIGSAIGVAISEFPSSVIFERYNETAVIKGVYRDQEYNPLHFSIIGEE